jgi:hypothetical protein
MFSPSINASPHRVRWTPWPFRLLSGIAAVLFALQAVFAGQMLSGTFGALQWHQNNAALADMVLFAAIPAALLLRWPGRGPLWPVFAVLGLLVLSYTQSALGFARLLTVHVPLGVAVILAAGTLAVWSWRHQAAPVPAPADGKGSS